MCIAIQQKLKCSVDLEDPTFFFKFFYLHIICCTLQVNIIISRRALAREGDYEMMPVCACVRACVRACVCACVS